MTEPVDLRDVLARVNALPPIRLEDAEMLARDYELRITGPDGDGDVHAIIRDPRTGVRHGARVGKATSKSGRAWLAWRDQQDD